MQGKASTGRFCTGIQSLPEGNPSVWTCEENEAHKYPVIKICRYTCKLLTATTSTPKAITGIIVDVYCRHFYMNPHPVELDVTCTCVLPEEI